MSIYATFEKLFGINLEEMLKEEEKVVLQPCLSQQLLEEMEVLKNLRHSYNCIVDNAGQFTTSSQAQEALFNLRSLQAKMNDSINRIRAMLASLKDLGFTNLLEEMNGNINLPAAGTEASEAATSAN